jgi:hypothetical protein
MIWQITSGANLAGAPQRGVAQTCRHPGRMAPHLATGVASDRRSCAGLRDGRSRAAHEAGEVHPIRKAC